MPTSLKWSSLARRRLRSGLGPAVVAATLAAPWAFADEEAPRVVVVSDDPDSTRSRRLTAELRSLGLIVISRTADADAAPEVALPALARLEHAMAAVQVLTSTSKEQVWVADRVTNKTLLRELPRSTQRPDQADDSIAVGVAELLRASLMEVNSAKPVRGEYAATPRVRELAYAAAAPPAPAGSSVWAAALGGVQPTLRGAGGAWLIRASLAWRLETGLGLEALGATTVTAISVRGRAGSAELSSQWLGIGPRLEWPARPTSWRGEVGLAIVGSRVVARGEQVPSPFTSATETAYSPGLYVHGGPAFARGRFQLRLDFGLLLLSSPANIHLADERTAVWGAPAAHVTLGIASRVWP